MAEAKSKKKKTVAYVPFKTFLSSIESLASHGMPSIIDRTVWPTYSGIVQSQVLSAYRFFGLVDDAGKPTAALTKLVEEPDNREATIRKLLEKYYSELMDLDLTTATPASFNKVMDSYAAKGDTLKKASSFFLQAARYSGLPLSPYILRQSRSTATRRKRKGTGRKKGRETARGVREGELPEMAPPTTGSTKTVTLANNVTLILTTSADTFKMTSEDRRFVMELLEKLEEYENKGKPAPTHVKKQPKGGKP